ncbi:hypothetical protein MY11210_005652 [Beauveria gryllotalpidicola]
MERDMDAHGMSVSRTMASESFRKGAKDGQVPIDCDKQVLRIT